MGSTKASSSRSGRLVVARQAEVHQHGGAVGAEHHVAGLDVQVHQALAVQVVQRGGHARRRWRTTSSSGSGAASSRGLQRLALDALHHDVGLAREVAARHELRHVRALQRRQDHLLDLEADDGEAAGSGAPPLMRGTFITSGHRHR
jgi:hypothetical protein